MKPSDREILAQVVLVHQCEDMDRCSCGWFVPNAFWAEHVVLEYELLETVVEWSRQR